MSDQDHSQGDSDRDQALRILNAYGTRPRRWPEANREQVSAFVEQNPDAKEFVELQGELDLLIESAPSIEPSATLRERILAAAPRQPLSWMARLDRWASRLWPLGPSWQPIAALAAAAVLGLTVGAFMPTTNGETDSQDMANVTLDESGDLGEVP